MEILRQLAELAGIELEEFIEMTKDAFTGRSKSTGNRTAFKYEIRDKTTGIKVILIFFDSKPEKFSYFSA